MNNRKYFWNSIHNLTPQSHKSAKVYNNQRKFVINVLQSWRVTTFSEYTIKLMSGKSMKGELNWHTSEAHAGIPQVSSLGPTLFHLYIIDLSKNTLRSLVNIHAAHITVYRCTSKYLDDKWLTVLLTFIVGSWLVSFNSSNDKIVTFHHHWAQPKAASISMKILLEGMSSKSLLTLNVYWV